MVQPSTSPNNFSADFDHHVVVCPTRSAAYVPTEPQGVVVLKVAGPLGEALQDLDKSIRLALADRPRGVVCDLSAVPAGAEPGAVQVLATAGRHVRDWPGIPIVVACPDPRVRDGLSAQPLGGHLIVAESMLPAVSAVLATPISDVDCLLLAPHPTAPRASRDFIARALLRWGLGPLVPAASLVASELVSNSTIHAGTDLELSVAWNLGLLRVTVRDNSPDLPRLRHPQLIDVHGRGLSVVAALSRALGVLPTAEGGKVVWAVLNAARPNPSTSNGMRIPDPGLLPPKRVVASLSTYLGPLSTTGDGLSQNEATTTDQRLNIYLKGTS